MYKRKLLGFELGAPPHVQIRRVFVCTSRVKELQRCENTDIAVKCYSYWGGATLKRACSIAAEFGGPHGEGYIVDTPSSCKNEPIFSKLI